MTTITEIECEKCKRPLISSGSANQSQTNTPYGFSITKCKHLYHQSCIRELYNTPSSPDSEEPRSFTCQHQKCAAPVKPDHIFTIIPTLQSRKIDSAGSTMPDENLKRALKIAQDTINQLKKIAQQSANDLTIAQSRIVELETKLIDANALYQKAIEDKSCQLVLQHSSRTGGQFRTNTNVLVPATLEMPKGNTKPKNIRTFDLTNDDESSEPRAQSYANAAAQASKPTAKQPTKTTIKQLPISAEVTKIPRTIASPMPKSIDYQNPTFNPPSPLTSFMEIPIGIPKLLANKESNKRQESEPKIPAYLIDRYSPPKRPAKRPAANRGPTAQTRTSHLRFQKRFKMDSEILKPFYPLNSYPLQYTAAGIHYANDVPKAAILAKDILMIGDGLIYGMVQFISKSIPFKFNLHPKLYRRDLSIEDLVYTLNTFPKLPPRIMLSIGNWDVFNSVENTAFYNNFRKLLRTFRSRRVEELYLMPLIRYTTEDSAAAFAYVDSVFQVDWGNTFGGKYMLMNPEPFFENLQPVVDWFGPTFEIEQFEFYVQYIRESLIPSATDNLSDNDDNLSTVS